MRLRQGEFPLPRISGVQMPTISKRLRFMVLRRDGFRCVYCGASGEQARLHVDHVEARAIGGTNSLSNLVTACEECNLGKGTLQVNLGPDRGETDEYLSYIRTDDGSVYFHTFVNGRVEWQGRLIRYIDQEGTTLAEVEFYSWIDGAPNGKCKITYSSGEREWRFYPTAKAMRWAYYAEMNNMDDEQIAFADRAQLLRMGARVA